MKGASEFSHTACPQAYNTFTMLGRKRGLTISEAAETYLAAFVGRAETTRRTYRYTLQTFGKAVGPDLSISSVGQDMITQYLAAIQARGSISYTVLVGKILHAFFSWIVGQGYIKSSPLDGVKIGTFPEIPIQPFSEKDIASLLEAATESYERAILLLLVDTGVRASELLGLKKGDIDLERNTMLVHGKGAADRIVALNAIPRKALLKCLKESRDGSVWPEGFNYRNLVTLLDKLGRRSGICCVHAHRFRHSWASSFLEETGDLMALKRLGGWRSWKQVERYVAWAETRRAITVHRKHSLVA